MSYSLKELFFINKNKKKGAPNKAVKIPMGNSVGLTIVRAMVSALVIKAAPNKAVATNKTLKELFGNNNRVR